MAQKKVGGNEMAIKCTGKYCAGAKVNRRVGRGSFKGWVLWICSHCGQVVKMEKQIRRK